MGPDNIGQACTILSEKLSQLSMPQSECTIYRVHSHLRNVNPKAYEPEVIAIGPYHRHKNDLKMMENHKLHNLQLLLQRKNENVEKYVSIIGPLESEARKCYAEPINLNATEFIEMRVLDGCFIIELVCRKNNDPIFRMDWTINSLQRDLMLFENQIPFFVLSQLFYLIEGVPIQSKLHLFSNFFNGLFPGRVPRYGTNVISHEIKHLLDLIHRTWRPSPSDSSDLGGPQFITCVSGLREANVKFERNEKDTMINIGFRYGIMLMPPLTIEDRTESFFRNLLVYEQYFHGTHFVTDYVTFFDCLIDSSKDVEILSRHGIIVNCLGDGEVVAKMVNKLGDSISLPGDDFRYATIFKDVNKHCEKRRNRWMAKLRRNYLNSPWAVISIIAAVVLLVLTVTQTVFTILQVV